MISVFFFNDTATTEIYTLSLHDALPISRQVVEQCLRGAKFLLPGESTTVEFVAGCSGNSMLKGTESNTGADRKSTRLNSSHANISYAVFCLKKKHRAL